MMMHYDLPKTALVAILLLISTSCFPSTSYQWLEDHDEKDSIAQRIPGPEGFERIKVEKGSYAQWLRNLPLKKGRPDVLLFDGKKKSNQKAHFAVVDIDVGERDLQQCADAVMRLRAEYLYSKKDYNSIHFNFASGHTAAFTKWAEGFRPRISGNKVEWRKTASNDSSRASFRKYLNIVFAYANSYSLAKELEAVEKPSEMMIGDVFIKGGFPGHAVIVVDMAVNPKTGKKAFLLAQSYMPAQDIHILRNPSNNKDNPWYDLDFGEKLVTPEWTFTSSQLMRFPQPE